LKAVLAPSLTRDQGSNRTGEVEIWWVSPAQWKREVRSPEFHQIAIVNGSQEWQKNEGEYFPEWLREVSVALIEPVPSLDQVLKQVKDSDVKKFLGTTDFSWMIMSTDGNVEKGMGAGVSINDNAGLLQGGSGLGWSGFYADYKSFHGRMVAWTVKAGSPEVTAKVTTLEDLRDVPSGFFDADVSGWGRAPLRTVVVEERSFRQNLLPVPPVAWPPLKDGPLEGVVTTEIVVDRAGKCVSLEQSFPTTPG
jgi:hypothetical protein